LFRQKTDEQLSVYITKIKINTAKSLLAHDSKKIYEVSNAVGFENPNYFAKVFRKYVGVSPQDYRNIFLNSDMGI